MVEHVVSSEKNRFQHLVWKWYGMVLWSVLCRNIKVRIDYGTSGTIPYCGGWFRNWYGMVAMTGELSSVNPEEVYLSLTV